MSLLMRMMEKDLCCSLYNGLCSRFLDRLKVWHALRIHVSERKVMLYLGVGVLCIALFYSLNFLLFIIT
jgi:hypothetical protein